MNIGGRTSFMTCLSLRWPVSLLSVLLLVVVPGQRGASAHGAPPSTSKPALTVTQESSLSQLRFEPNMGRGVRAVRFIARSSHALWLFSPRSIALDLNRGASHQEALRLAPVSPSPSTFITASEQLPGVTNYLLGNNPRTWQTGIPTFAQIRYHSIFPGIDLIFHGNGSTMELRWLVAPGGDPARIVLSVQNATRLRLASDGSLIATTAMGNIRQLAPHIYQTVGGRRRIVPGHFVLHARHRVGIWIGAYDRDRPLIIDPTLRYSATLSGSLDDDANAVAVDSAGNAYVTGSTQSDNFPVQTPLQPALGGENDAFVTKLDPTGKIIYSTYLGGSRSDEGFGLAVDGAGDVFVAGSTNSKNFPTTPGALQAKLGGGTCPNGGNTYACEDAFVVKLDPTGRVPLYSTYLGGNLEDYALGLALDSQRDAIVVGSTNSRNIPIVHALESTLRAQTCGAYAATYKCPDAFVAKLNPAGSALLFSTFLGGADYDLATAVAIGPTGMIAITGQTYSADFPVVHGMHRVQRTPCKIFQAPAGRCPRAFVAALTDSGSKLKFSSYLGGSRSDSGSGVAVDVSGNVYVAGQTTSSDFPVAHSAQLPHYKGYCHDSKARYPCPDAFVTKFNVKTGEIVYSSRIGGTSLDGASAVAVNSHDDAYVSGFTGSYNFPTLHALRKHSAGGEDAFVLELNKKGDRAYFSTYLGGEHDDAANGIALGPGGDVYVVGSTDSPKFPKKIKYGPAHRGLDAFVVRVRVGALKAAKLPVRGSSGAE